MYRSIKAGLLARAPNAFSCLPKKIQWHRLKKLTLTVAGPHRNYTDFPFHFTLVKNLYNIQLILLYMKIEIDNDKKRDPVLASLFYDR
jgi:hypothetical protein